MWNYRASSSRRGILGGSKVSKLPTTSRKMDVCACERKLYAYYALSTSI